MEQKHKERDARNNNVNWQWENNGAPVDAERNYPAHFLSVQSV